MFRKWTRSAALFAALTAGNAYASTVSYTVTDLGALPGGRDVSAAYGINDAGQIVGESETATGRRAFLLDESHGIRDLGDLPGGDDFSAAYDLNEAGEVVGLSGAATGSRAFLWDETSGMRDLGDLPGDCGFSRANDINDAGLVVGSGNSGSYGTSAFLWNATGGMRNLNDLIDPREDWILRSAEDNNDSGHIVGWGYNGTADRAFLLTPGVYIPAVPLPAGAWLMIPAFLGLGLLKRRGRKAAAAYGGQSAECAKARGACFQAFPFGTRCVSVSLLEKTVAVNR